MTRSVSEILNTKLIKRTEILGTWLTAGEVVLLYAKTGIGKTMCALNMMAAITSGKSYLGWEAERPRRCVYVDTELGTRIIQERLASIYANYNESGAKNAGIINHEDCGGSMWNLAVTEYQKKYISLWKTYDVIFIDNYLGIAWSEKGENDATIWRKCWKCLKLLRDANKTVVLVHHSSKDARNQHGTTLRSNDCDTIINLRPAQESGEGQSLEFYWHFDKTRNFGGDMTKPFWCKYINNKEQCLYYWEKKDAFEHKLDLAREMLKNYGTDRSHIYSISRELFLQWHVVDRLAKEMKSGPIEVDTNNVIQF